MILTNLYKILSGVTGITYKSATGQVTDSAITKGWNQIMTASSNASRLYMELSSDTQNITPTDYSITNPTKSYIQYTTNHMVWSTGNNDTVVCLATYTWTNNTGVSKIINSVGFGVSVQGYTSEYGDVLFTKENLIEPVEVQNGVTVTFTVKFTFGISV